MGADRSDTKEQVGQRLRWTREALGYTQEYIATILGLSGASAWANYETAVNMISRPVASRLCAVCGCSLDWIYHGNMGGLDQRLAAKIQEQIRQASA